MQICIISNRFFASCGGFFSLVNYVCYVYNKTQQIVLNYLINFIAR